MANDKITLELDKDDADVLLGVLSSEREPGAIGNGPPPGLRPFPDADHCARP
ncbi:MAG TPA: hypothetical protein VFM51_00940 [Solirubrobacterales bacterium]|nr:hypothetical protein [Solirubrobacterales bacterium]